MNTQSITLDVSKQTGMMPVIRIGQGDKNGTTIEATIYDNGSPLSLPGYSVRFEMRLPDGTSYYQSPNGTVSGNVATIPIDETYAGAVDGITKIAYIVVCSSTVECSTNRINVVVLESAEEGADAAHAYESGIVEATNAANAAAQSATNAAASASSAASSATTAAGNASTQAAAAQTAATSANGAASSANQAAAAAQRNAEAAQTAATAANAAAVDANDATERAEAAIEAMGDISELAVPLMTTGTRGGAKLGGSVQTVEQALEIKLVDNGSGESVTAESASYLNALKVHGGAVQDGTPTPSAPVDVRVVEGRNLLDPQTSEEASASKTTAGLTCEYEGNGIFHLYGTATNTAATVLRVFGSSDSSKIINEQGTYTLSVTVSGTSLSSDLRVQLLSANGSDSITTNDGIRTITTDYINNVRFFLAAGLNGQTVDTRVKFQIEKGATATPYTPYGCIGLQIGDTVTPIDLQGNVLASLPDGTRDELIVDSAGHVTIEKCIGNITFNGGETWTLNGGGKRVNNAGLRNVVRKSPNNYTVIQTVCTNFTPQTASQTYSGTVGVSVDTSGDIGFANGETMAVNAWRTWLESNPVIVYYPLATPRTIDLGTIDPPAIPSGSVLAISAALSTTFEAAWWTEKAAAIPEALQDYASANTPAIDSISASVAPVEDSISSTNYAVGSYIVCGGQLYRVTTAIATGESIVPGSNCTAVNVMAELVRLTA